MPASVYLAVDLGASSGRVMAGILDGHTLELKELNRFATQSVEEGGSWFWEVEAIFESVMEGLRLAAETYGSQVAGIGVDTWGVDYALLDHDGKLLGKPYLYRDARTEGVGERIQEIVTREEIYRETGIQFLFFNTINQLFAEKRDHPERMEAAAELLFMPDLFSYWLCGAKIQERTMASTSQLLNPVTGRWSEALLQKLDLPGRLFKPITEPGTRIGTLLPEVRARTGLGPVPVFAVAGHDTGSAVAGAPLREGAPAFLSSGTWSLMGVEARQPIINAETLAASYSNEAGVEGTTRFLKNICGMWLIEQLKAEWGSPGNEIGYEAMVEMAREAAPFQALIDPDDDRFARPGPMERRIRGFCRSTGQKEPEGRQGVLRTVYDSLACKYRLVFDHLSRLSGKPLNHLQVVGGGARNRFLNQCTANALDCRVTAGPVEATSLGNILLQLIGDGRLESLAAGRSLLEASCDFESFAPEDSGGWEEPVERLKAILPN